MATPRTGTSEAKTRSKLRKTFLPFDDHVLDLRNANPDIFETYDAHAIARELLKSGALAQENVQLELAMSVLSTFRRRFDPNFDVVTRTTTTTPRTPKMGDLAEAFIYGQFNPDRMMSDGRRLRQWSVGELRKDHKGMSALIERLAGLADDELIEDHLDLLS